MLEVQIVVEEEIIKIPYYNLGKFLEEKCKEFTNESIENRIIFEKFSENYNHFKPYFDFSLIVLGYKIVNTIIGKYHYGIDSRNVCYSNKGEIEMISFKDYLLENYKKKQIYSKCSDDGLQIKVKDSKNVGPCIIDNDGISYLVNRDKKQYHSFVYEMLLNQAMMYNEEICNDYYAYINDKNKGNYLGKYFSNTLGFITINIEKDQTGYLLYNDNLTNQEAEEFIDEIVLNNPGLTKYPTDKNKICGKDNRISTIFKNETFYNKNESILKDKKTK